MWLLLISHFMVSRILLDCWESLFNWYVCTKDSVEFDEELRYYNDDSLGLPVDTIQPYMD